MDRSTESTRIGAIMAGGTGERFWPVSRADRPKQLLPLGPSNRTLLEDTVLRFDTVIPSERLLVVTSGTLREPIAASDVPLEDRQILAEPAKRNTLGAIAWLTAQVTGGMGLPPESTTLGIVSADQYVGDVEALRGNLSLAFSAAERLNALVIVGIEPSRPETGYGYIEAGESAAELLPEVDGADRLHRVASFREKPDAATAQQFFTSGRYLWNAGMFFWRVSAFMRELQQAQPEIATLVRRMTRAIATGDDAGAKSLFEELPDISIDYALMEGAREVLMVRAGFPWDDVGAWDAWQRVSELDADGNAVSGNPLLIECRQCAVYNEPGQDEMAVAVVGMERVIVALGRQGLVVAPLERAQEVRDVVRRLTETGHDGSGSE